MSTASSEPTYYKCGVFGCILEERHPGLCIFPMRRCLVVCEGDFPCLESAVEAAAPPSAAPPPPLVVRTDLCVPASAGSPLAVRVENSTNTAAALPAVKVSFL